MYFALVHVTILGTCGQEEFDNIFLKDNLMLDTFNQKIALASMVEIGNFVID